jgi:hypothetical protein
LSIAWTRIIPTGIAGSPINPKGVAFYKALITELLKEGIVPAVTMYHCGWLGGWRVGVVGWGWRPHHGADQTRHRSGGDDVPL